LEKEKKESHRDHGENITNGQVNGLDINYVSLNLVEGCECCEPAKRATEDYAHETVNDIKHPSLPVTQVLEEEVHRNMLVPRQKPCRSQEGHPEQCIFIELYDPYDAPNSDRPGEDGIAYRKSDKDQNETSHHR
jgi:hypothetical protein